MTQISRGASDGLTTARSAVPQTPHVFLHCHRQCNAWHPECYFAETAFERPRLGIQHPAKEHLEGVVSLRARFSSSSPELHTERASSCASRRVQLTGARSFGPLAQFKRA